MAASLSGVFSLQEFSDAGALLVSGRLYTYTSGTTTLKTAYTDAAGLVAHTYTSDGLGGSYIALNARGELPAPLFLTSGAYDICLKRADGSTVWTRQATGLGDAFATLSASLASSANGSGVDLIGGSGRIVATIAALRALLKTGVGRAFVLGYYAAGDGGGGQYFYDSTDVVSSDNGGTIIVASDSGRWKLVNQTLVTNKQFGAVVDGVTNDTTANQALLTACRNVAFVAGTSLISVALATPSNTTVIVNADAIVTTATPDISVFTAISATNVHFQGSGKIQCTATTGVAASIGLINLTGATNCDVVGLELAGFQWAGVLMSGSTNCEVLNCKIHDFLAAVQDCAGVHVTDGATNCRVVDCEIKNPGYHGVNVQERGGGLVPQNTIIRGCNISGCKVYGVNCYNKTNNTTNQFTQILGGSISDVLGGSPYNTSGGAGIYFQQAGGCSAKGVHIEYVCSKTSDNSLTAAGVGSAVYSPLIAPVIEGNTFFNIGFTPAGVQNPNAVTLAAISINSGSAGATIGPNTMNQTLANTAGSFGYVGIYVNAAPNVSIAPQNMVINPLAVNSQGIFFNANGVNLSGGTINPGVISGCDYAHVRIDQSGGFTVSGVSIAGGTLTGGSANCVPLRISSGVNINVSGVTALLATTSAALALSVASNCKITNSSFTSTGTSAITTNGACAGTLIDETVNFAADSKMLNAGTGCTVKTRGSAAPVAGTWAVGDLRSQSVPVVGNPKQWRCTVAGAPGTHVSEGNL